MRKSKSQPFTTFNNILAFLNRWEKMLRKGTSHPLSSVGHPVTEMSL